MTMGDASKNFNYDEFGCKCDCCIYITGKHIDHRVIELAQKIREELSRPLQVNSACRCLNHNDKVGGSLNSKHLPTNGFVAVDLGIMIGFERSKAIKIALDMGASVGVNPKFLHFDFRNGKPIVFLY
jgi:Peptidase M15